MTSAKSNSKEQKKTTFHVLHICRGVEPAWPLLMCIIKHWDTRHVLLSCQTLTTCLPSIFDEQSSWMHRLDAGAYLSLLIETSDICSLQIEEFCISWEIKTNQLWLNSVFFVPRFFKGWATYMLTTGQFCCCHQCLDLLPLQFQITRSSLSWIWTAVHMHMLRSNYYWLTISDSAYENFEPAH